MGWNGSYTVNQEHVVDILATLYATAHSILQQLHRHLHGHNGALLDVRLDHLPKLATLTVLLLAKQVTGREVLEAIVADELLALCALPRTRPAKYKEDGDLVAGPNGRATPRGGELLDSGHDGASVGVKASLGLYRWVNGLEWVPWADILHLCAGRQFV